MMDKNSSAGALVPWAWRRLEQTLAGSPPSALTPRVLAQRLTVQALVEPFAAQQHLEAASVTERRALLLGLSARLAPPLLDEPARPELAALAERVIAEAERPDADELWLAFWAGFPPSLAAWELLTPDQEAALVTRWVQVGGVSTEETLLATLARLLEVPPELVPAAMDGLTSPDPDDLERRLRHRLDALALARVRALPFGHSALEHTLVASLTPPSRLAVMGRVAATSAITRFVAHAWAVEADPLLPAPTPSNAFARALAELRFAAIAAAAGAAQETSPWLDSALMVASTLSPPTEAAELYVAAFETEARFGLGTWLRAVELALSDRRLAKDPQAFARVRRAVADTWRGLARGFGDAPGEPDELALDRGLDLLRATLRRLPDPWLELRVLSASLELGVLAGRDPSGPIAQLERWSRRPLVSPEAPPTALEDEALRASAESLVALGRPDLLGWVETLAPALRVELLTALALAARRVSPPR